MTERNRVSENAPDSALDEHRESISALKSFPGKAHQSAVSRLRALFRGLHQLSGSSGEASSGFGTHNCGGVGV